MTTIELFTLNGALYALTREPHGRAVLTLVQPAVEMEPQA